MVTDMTHTGPDTSLPRSACRPINRCNVPPVILGSLTFQRHPEPVHIDGVATFHADLFVLLDKLTDATARAEQFQDYMAVQFRLKNPEDAGGQKGHGRAKADYLRTLRGWFFDSDGREGAVLKSWAESRFGLLPRHHNGVLGTSEDAGFLLDRAAGLHNTNALEAQLDLVFAYCQYELARRFVRETHITLYRGVNRLNHFDIIEDRGPHDQALLFNNVNSFTTNRDMAGAFGDHILTVRVPRSKVIFFSGLLPGRMQGEDEYIVLGGVYDVTSTTY